MLAESGNYEYLVFKIAVKPAVDERGVELNHGFLACVKEWRMVERVAFGVILAVAAAAQAERTPTSNLLDNGSFEAEWTGRQPPGFRVGPVDSRTKATGIFGLSTDAHSGKHALRIERSIKPKANSSLALRLIR